MRQLPASVALIVVVLAACDALACQCGNRPNARAAAEKWSDIVITGTIVETEPMKLQLRLGGRKSTVSVSRVVIEVDRIWKGSTNGHLVLTQGVTNCDYVNFQMGGRYLVFASKIKLGDDGDSKTAWSANRCLPTQGVGTAANELIQLGSGVIVNAPRRPQRHSESWFRRTCRALGLSS